MSRTLPSTSQNVNPPTGTEAHNSTPRGQEVRALAGYSDKSANVPYSRRDPEDNRFLECALAGRARHLVTGDQDLRELRFYRGITILTVGEFLEQTGLYGNPGS